MRRVSLHILAAAAALVAVAAPVHGQGWAVRGGANVNPDQVYVGGSYELPLAERLSFHPSGDIGFGNDARLFAGNLDLVYRVWNQRRGPWRFEAGGGPTLNHYRLATYAQTETGVNALAALVHAGGWASEFRIGFLDNPEFRAGISYRWRSRAAARPPRRRVSGR